MNLWQTLITIALAALFVPLLIWWGLWLSFAMLALLPARHVARSLTRNRNDHPPARIDILIPAHNEELLLPRLLETLHRQTALLRIGRTLVVADHCTDRTAALAREGHAEVLERSAGPRGKPAALRDGLAYLNIDPANAPSYAVLILDADCTASPNLIEHCAAALDGGAEVVQAAYILDAVPAAPLPHSGTGAGHKLHNAAAIAFALKNCIRPRGMARLGIPTQLFGTGMCFRAAILPRLSFADHLTEDLALSYELLLAGVRPQLLPHAAVRSPLPGATAGMATQKLRWETGQIHTWSKLPAILFSLVAARKPGWLRSAVAVIEWSAPPLAMAVLLWLGVTFASVGAVATHLASLWLFALPAACMAMLIAYVIIGGSQACGVSAVARLSLAVPRFFLWKVRLYMQMLAGHAPRSWQRTQRSAQPIAGGRST